jgi:hypothetical protein
MHCSAVVSIIVAMKKLPHYSFGKPLKNVQVHVRIGVCSFINIIKIYNINKHQLYTTELRERSAVQGSINYKFYSVAFHFTFIATEQWNLCGF